MLEDAAPDMHLVMIKMALMSKDITIVAPAETNIE
jgi:hypothetical protein